MRLSDRKVAALLTGVLPVLALYSGACGSAITAVAPSAGPSASEPIASTYTWINENIIQTQCLFCHVDPDPPHGLDFSTYEEIAGSYTVIAGLPEASDFYLALASGAMPKGGARLSLAELNAISDWIKAGAKKLETDSGTGMPDSLPSVLVPGQHHSPSP